MPRMTLEWQKLALRRVHSKDTTMLHALLKSSMRASLLYRSLLALACSVIPSLASAAATLSWVPGSLDIVRGQVAYMDLRISGLTEDSVWNYFVGVTYDPSVVHLTGVSWGDGAGHNQLVCPGATPETCIWIGSRIETNLYDWPRQEGSYYFAENANGLNWSEENLNAIQLDDFVLLHLRFIGMNEGTTSLAAGGYYGSSAWFSTYHELPTTVAQVDVMLTEPASWLLCLPGLAALLARRALVAPARRRIR